MDMRQQPRIYSTLTIRQPWADLILCGIKDVENRSWPTSFRGQLLIHTAKRVEWEAVDYLMHEHGFVFPEAYRPRTGAILGTVELTDCVSEHNSPFFNGPYGFVLSKPRLFRNPVDYRGQLGIFKVPADHLASIASEIQGPTELGAPSLLKTGVQLAGTSAEHAQDAVTVHTARADREIWRQQQRARR